VRVPSHKRSGPLALILAVAGALASQAGVSGADARLARPHPADECWVEAQYVPERAVLEIAVRVDGLTFDQALSAFVERDVKLDDPKGEVAAAAYLAEGLVFEYARARGGEARWERCRVRYVGCEFDGPDAWLFAQIDLPAEPARLSGSIDVLMDRFATQRNDLEVTSPAGLRRHVFLWTSGPADLSYLLRPPAP
jgi:hypothetical protein